MSYGGSVSAMISSLKVNNSLRRKNKYTTIFSKKPIVTQTDEYNPISKEENLVIIQENKEKLKKQTLFKFIYGSIMTLIFGSIVTLLFFEFLKWI